MELKIVGDSLATVKVAMMGFKKDFKESLDLEKSLEKNFAVIDSGEIKPRMLFNLVHLCLDWSGIIELLPTVDDEFMEVRFFRCEFRGKIHVSPGVVEEGRRFEFKEEKEDGEDIILVNSFVESPYYDLMSYLKCDYFEYGHKKWKPVVEWR